MQELTDRQQQCLRGFFERKTAKEIGRELGISHHAVEQHLKEARRKLGALTTRDAARQFAAFDTTGRPYYGSPDVRGCAHEQLDGNRRFQEHEVANYTLRDSAGEHKGFVYGFTAVQTLGAILLVGLGLVAILAMMIAVAQGIATITR